MNQAWVVPYASCGQGPSLTAAAAASMLGAGAKIATANGYWQVGKRWRIEASGIISSVITTPGTARFDLRMGSNVVFDSLAIALDSVAAHVNVGWRLSIDLRCETIGSGTTATLRGQGTWTCEDILGVPASAPKGVLSAILPWNTGTTIGGGFDSTAANTVDMFFTQTVATGSMTLNMLDIYDLN